MQQFETFVCNIKADFYKIVGDVILYSATLVALYEKWIILHGFVLMFTIRFSLMIYDIYRRVKDARKDSWDNQVQPILEEDAIREKRKSIWVKIADICKLIFFR